MLLTCVDHRVAAAVLDGSLWSRFVGSSRCGRQLACGVAAAVVTLGCSGAGELPAGFVAQCLGVSVDGVIVGEASVCRLDEFGEIEVRSDIGLARGLPYVVDPQSDQIVAISQSGDVIDVSDTEARFVTEADAATAYGFTSDSRLVGLTTSGELRSADGELLSEFVVDGIVDFESGVDLRDDEVAFTVQLPSGGFAVVTGDVSSGEVSEVSRSDEYIGQPRWSPDGSRLCFVGPDYRSIEIVTRRGDPVTSFTPVDARVSGRFNAPRWIDDDTIAFFDAVPALLEGDVRTGQVEVTKIYELGSGIDAVPVLPVPLGP